MSKILLIYIIINWNVAQRAEIRNYYKSCYWKDLIKRLKEDTSVNFKVVFAGMFMIPAEFDAMCLYKLIILSSRYFKNINLFYLKMLNQKSLLMILFLFSLII